MPYSNEWLETATDEEIRQIDAVTDLLIRFQSETNAARANVDHSGEKRFGDWSLEIIEAVMGALPKEYAVMHVLDEPTSSRIIVTSDNEEGARRQVERLNRHETYAKMAERRTAGPWKVVS